MKRKLLLLFLLLAFNVKAQLVLLDEPLGEGSGSVYSLAVYDNDIFYTMVKDNSTFTAGVFISNGVPEDRIELMEGTNNRAYFNINSTGDQVRLYGNGNYTSGNTIYAGVVSSGGLNRIYKLQ